MKKVFEKLNAFLNQNKFFRPIKWRFAFVYHYIIYQYITNRSYSKIQVFGLKRSGNHGIINWLYNQLDGSVSFCNDLNFAQKPYTAPIRKSKISFKTKESTLITSFEDYSIETIKQNISSQAQVIIIIRDPFNLFASRFTKKMGDGDKFRQEEAYRLEIIKKYKGYLKEYLLNCNLENNYSPNIIFITYNQWHFDKNYRDSICQKLGIVNKDIGKDEILNVGGGSSFDGLEFKASEIKVFKRWEVFQEKEDYRKIFRDKELLQLTEKVFPEMYALTSQWITSI